MRDRYGRKIDLGDMWLFARYCATPEGLTYKEEHGIFFRSFFNIAKRSALFHMARFLASALLVKYEEG